MTLTPVHQDPAAPIAHAGAAGHPGSLRTGCGSTVHGTNLLFAGRARESTPPTPKPAAYRRGGSVVHDAWPRSVVRLGDGPPCRSIPPDRGSADQHRNHRAPAAVQTGLRGDGGQEKRGLTARKRTLSNRATKRLQRDPADSFGGTVQPRAGKGCKPGLGQMGQGSGHGGPWPGDLAHPWGGTARCFGYQGTGPGDQGRSVAGPRDRGAFPHLGRDLLSLGAPTQNFAAALGRTSFDVDRDARGGRAGEKVTAGDGSRTGSGGGEEGIREVRGEGEKSGRRKTSRREEKRWGRSGESRGDGEPHQQRETI